MGGGWSGRSGGLEVGVGVGGMRVGCKYGQKLQIVSVFPSRISEFNQSSRGLMKLGSMDMMKFVGRITFPLGRAPDYGRGLWSVDVPDCGDWTAVERSECPMCSSKARRALNTSRSVEDNAWYGMWAMRRSYTQHSDTQASNGPTHNTLTLRLAMVLHTTLALRLAMVLHTTHWH